MVKQYNNHRLRTHSRFSCFLYSQKIEHVFEKPHLAYITIIFHGKTLLPSSLISWILSPLEDCISQGWCINLNIYCRDSIFCLIDVFCAFGQHTGRGVWPYIGKVIGRCGHSFSSGGGGMGGKRGRRPDRVSRELPNVFRTRSTKGNGGLG